MIYRLAADFVVVLHLAFILFVVGGGFLALKWRAIAWIHVPVVVYGAVLEFFSWVCILTPLENWLRVRGGSQGYETSFTEHYILPLIYPSELTYRLQVILGIFVLTINLIAYGLFVMRR
jgi:uncharacterized membrane protein YhhN